MAWPEGKNLRWILITFLQRFQLPWPTLGLVANAITADALSSRYSSYAKSNWSQEEWMEFLEKSEKIIEEYFSSTQSFIRDHNYTELNQKLESLNRQLISLGNLAHNDLHFDDRRPISVKSVSWLFRMFLERGGVPPEARLLMIEATDLDLRKAIFHQHDETASHYIAYKQLFEHCELAIGEFLEERDPNLLQTKLEKMLSRLKELPTA